MMAKPNTSFKTIKFGMAVADQWVLIFPAMRMPMEELRRF
jgi:hypothetical protein